MPKKHKGNSNFVLKLQLSNERMQWAQKGTVFKIKCFEIRDFL